MQATTTYIHALRGRLRVKIWEVKRCPTKALELAETLQRCAGISLVTANPTTGNVLIHYDADRIGQTQIIQTLQGLGYLQASRVEQRAAKDPCESSERAATAGCVSIGRDTGLAKAPSEPIEELATALLQSLTRSVVELAVQRLVMALI